MNVNAVFMAAALAMTGFASTALCDEPNPLKLTPHHATISVADLDKESQWYASVLGFEKSNPFDYRDSKGCSMVIPGYRVDLIQQKGSSRKDTRLGLQRQGWLPLVFPTPMI